MGEATITQANWRLVEVGRVVLIQNDGPSNGRLAAVVEIIDHKRVCPYHVEPSGKELGGNRDGKLGEQKLLTSR